MGMPRAFCSPHWKCVCQNSGMYLQPRVLSTYICLQPIKSETKNVTIMSKVALFMLSDVYQKNK